MNATALKYVREESADCVVLAPAARASACVIWLHGLGADGYDFVPIVSELSLSASCAPRFVFPHAPLRAVTINSGMRMRAWYDIVGLEPGSSEDDAGICASAALLDEFVGRERAAGIAAESIVVAGFSQGGAIALQSALRSTERLAGVMALSTYLPLHARAAEWSAVSREIPILMCHGRYDPLIPLIRAEQSRDLLRSAGYALEWKLYPMQHQVCVEEIIDIGAWLERVLGRRCSRS